MRFYHRTQQDKIDTVYNRCFWDAKNGKVCLALLRLKDLAEEFPNDAHVIYAEALIRKDFLGQGIIAHSLFKNAFELGGIKEAACNATKYAPSKNDFEKMSKKAISVAPNDDLLLLIVSEQNNYSSEEYWQFLYEMLPPQGEMDGSRASLLELILNACGDNIEKDKIILLHRVRAESLRDLDRAAENSLIVQGEQFIPEERLALQEALKELEKVLSDKNSPAFYDPELWNLRSAYTYLMHQFEHAITYADMAIKYRPTGYALPHLNKALSFWELGMKDEALPCAQEALRQAEVSRNSAHIKQVRQAIKDHTVYKPATLNEFIPYLKQVLYGAGNVAEKEISDSRGKLENISKNLLKRVRIVGAEWSMAYVNILAELLSLYSPEAASFIVAKAAISEQRMTENILCAALYLIGHSEGVMQRDATRFLALLIIAPLDTEGIRITYRMGILEVSASASDGMSNLDFFMRKELSRMHPMFPSLIAEQEPIDEEGKKRAKRDILTKFEGTIPDFTSTFSLPEFSSSNEKVMINSLSVSDILPQLFPRLVLFLIILIIILYLMGKFN